MKKLLKALVALSFVSNLVACSTNDTSNNDSKKDSYTIGLIYEMTGAVGDYGTAESKGSKLAIKLANQNDSSVSYNFSEYDTKSDLVQAVQIANQLANEKIIGVVGPATSGASAAIYPIMSEYKVAVVSPSATQNNITFVNPEDLSSGVYENVFRVCFEDSYQGLAMARFAYNDLSKRNVFVYTDSSSDYGTGLANTFVEEFKSLGGNVVSQDFYVSGDKEFSAVLTKVKDLNIDSIYIAGYYNEAGLIIKQAKELGIDVTVLGGDGFDSQSFASLAGASNLNNVYFTTGYTNVNPSSKLQNFIDEYKKEYNEEPGLFAALAYDSTLCLIEAHKNSLKNNSTVSSELAKLSFEGITGSFTFDEKHNPIKSVMIVELVDGVQKNSYSIETE